MKFSFFCAAAPNFFILPPRASSEMSCRKKLCRGRSRNFSLEKVEGKSHFFKSRLFDDLWFLRVKIDARVGRPPVINLKFPAIIITKHRTKTPRTKEKEKNWEQLLPKTPFPPPHSDEPLSFARQRRKFFTGKTRRKIALFFVMNKSAFMIFASQNRRAVRSAPLINSIFPAIIIPEHRAKTPRTEKKKKNWSSCSPKRRSHPLTLMNLFLLRGSAEFFDFTLPWFAGAGGGDACGSRTLPPRASWGKGCKKKLCRGRSRIFSLEKLE